jgi:hypothetical protein
VSFALFHLDNVPCYFGAATSAVGPTIEITSITKSSPLAVVHVTLNVTAVDALGFRIILHMTGAGKTRIPYMTTIPNVVGSVVVTMPANKLFYDETLVVYGTTDAQPGSGGTPLGLLLTITTPTVAGVAAQSIPTRTTALFTRVETHGQLAAALPFKL